MVLLLALLRLFLVSVLPGLAISVTLQAGAHLDLNVAVLVQKGFTGEGCQDFEQLDNDCLRRKCAQSVQYKVDLGYSNVRRTVNGMLYEHPEGRENFLIRKNQASLELAKKVARLNNDAFQPFLFTEFEHLITDFYDGHVHILALFNLSMEDLVNEHLSMEKLPENADLPCSELPTFNEVRNELVEMLEGNWQINWTKHRDGNATDLTFFELIKLRLPPSPIPMIECYSVPEQKQSLVNYTNQLFRLLLHLSNMSQPLRPSLSRECLSLLNRVDRILRNESLVSRLHYSPARSLFMRDIEALLGTKAARGQVGTYSENNFATIRFRFMSMTAIRMEESREYNNFNLLVDLGSTLGLYFGLTILTLFELFIFLFYRTGSRDPTEVQKLPPQSLIYNIPENGPNEKAGGGKLKRRKRKRGEGDGEDGDGNDLNNFVFPVIF